MPALFFALQQRRWLGGSDFDRALLANKAKVFDAHHNDRDRVCRTGFGRLLLGFRS